MANGEIALALVVLAVYCQYILAHYNPFRSTILVFLVFMFSNFLLFRLNTAHQDHVSTFSVCWSKWLIIGGFFVYLFNNCEQESKKKMLKNVFIMITILILNS
jgi:hypothetical protein